MTTQLSKLEHLLNEVKTYIQNCPKKELEYRSAPDKWSKKEILGHLVDSGINNLQRFTEIQFEPKPYVLRNYNQDELVKANDYQNAEVGKILDLFLSLNHRILKILEKQPLENLTFKMIYNDDTTVDLAFWIDDYVNHAAHHVKQIMD